jgi:hypothetical protein
MVNIIENGVDIFIDTYFKKSYFTDERLRTGLLRIDLMLYN